MRHKGDTVRATPRLMRICVALPLLVLSGRLAAVPADVAHPFILWNKQDLATIRAKISTHAWARAELEQLKQWRGYGTVHRNLFLFLVTGDRKTGQAEKKDLL